jgi:hypothetical protein
MIRQSCWLLAGCLALSLISTPLLAQRGGGGSRGGFSSGGGSSSGGGFRSGGGDRGGISRSDGGSRSGGDRGSSSGRSDGGGSRSDRTGSGRGDRGGSSENGRIGRDRGDVTEPGTGIGGTRPDRDRPPTNDDGDKNWRRRPWGYGHVWRYGGWYYDPYWYDPFYSSWYGFGIGVGGDREKRGRREKENVVLRIEPRNALVYVNGILMARSSRTEFSLPTGRWRLEIVAPGYRTLETDVEIQQGVQFRLERKLERLAPGEQDDPRAVPLNAPAVEQGTGALDLVVEPESSALVYLDGKILCLASQVRSFSYLQKVPAGPHEVEVRAPGYVTQKQEVFVSPLRPAKLEFRLEPEPAR